MEFDKSHYSVYVYLLYLHSIIITFFIFMILKDWVSLGKVFIFGILYFIITSLFSWLLSRNYHLKDNFKEKFIGTIFISFLSIFLFGLSEAAIDTSNKINLNLPFRTYNFDISFQPQSNIILNDFNLNFNFASKDGKIKFIMRVIDESIGTNAIVIDYPDILNIIDYKIELNNTALVENKDYVVSNRVRDDGNNFIVFSDFSRSLEGAYVEMNVESRELLPNGKYVLYISSKFVWTDYTITFNLGDFDCKSICFGDLDNIETEIVNNTLKLNYPKNYYGENQNMPKILFQRANLNFLNMNDKTLKDNLVNFQIGLLISGFLLLGEFLRDLIVLSRYNYKKRKTKLARNN